VKDANGIPSKL